MLQQQQVRFIEQTLDYITIFTDGITEDGTEYKLWQAILVSPDDDDKVDTFATVKVDKEGNILETTCMEGKGAILRQLKEEVKNAN